MNDYKSIYDRSIKDPDGFWAEQAERLEWIKKWDKVSNVNFNNADIHWYEGGKLNASYNCLDRHVKDGNGNDIALLWEGNNPLDDKKFTDRKDAYAYAKKIAMSKKITVNVVEMDGYWLVELKRSD